MIDFELILIKYFKDRMIEDHELCKNIWSALANVTWYNPEAHIEVSYSFRAAGGLIAEIIGQGDYMEWYCSGPYATISDEIRRVMKKEGWIADTMSTICQAPMCLKDAGYGYPHNGKYYWSCIEHHSNKDWTNEN